MDSSSLPHIAIFPFMSKGHTIPLLHLAHLLHRRRLAALTFFTTPRNSPFIRASLAGVETDVIELPFPENIPDVLPQGIESTDHLPSMSLFLPFVRATELLQPGFERAISGMPSITFLISDLFLSWTVESAVKFAIPRVMFSGMGHFAFTINRILATTLPHAGISDADKPFAVPGFPELLLIKADLSPSLNERDVDNPMKDFVLETRKATAASYGIVSNTFYELEAEYTDCWNRNFEPKAWCVGPLCLARPKADEAAAEGELMQWLDSRSAMKRPVLYVAFGSQAEISAAQAEEIAIGLENSGLDFLWIMRAKQSRLGEGFEERVADRGRVIRTWVDQMEILGHESVKGFVSHCGWNSVMESVCAGVPILAWPMIAEQHLNAKFVVDELKIGLRIRARDCGRNGLVMHEDISNMARELVLGEKGRMAREKVENFADLAARAMADCGSSSMMLEMMIEELSRKRAELRNGKLGDPAAAL